MVNEKQGAAELGKLIGKHAYYNVKGMDVEVIIQDVKTNFGAIDYTVAPAKGTGLAVVRDSLRIIDDPTE